MNKADATRIKNSAGLTTALVMIKLPSQEIQGNHATAPGASAEVNRWIYVTHTQP